MNLWKDNRTAGLYTMTDEEVKEAFLTWGEKNIHKLGGWTLDRCLRDFFTGPESMGGLSSVFDNADYALFYNWLRPQNVYVLVTARVNETKFPVE